MYRRLCRCLGSTAIFPILEVTASGEVDEERQWVAKLDEFSRGLLIYFLFHCLVRFHEEIDGLEDLLLKDTISRGCSPDQYCECIDARAKSKITRRVFYGSGMCTH